MRRRWLVCILAAGCLSGISSVVYAFGVFFEPIQRTFDISSHRVSMVFSVHTLSTYAFGAAVGYVADRYAGHRLLAVGAVCWAAGLVGTATSGSYLGVVVAFGLLVAFGFGVTYIVVYATIARWFERRRGLAMSVLSVGFGLGGLCGPPLAEALLTRVAWTQAYLVFAAPTTVAIAATAAAFVLLARAESPPRPGVSGSNAPRSNPPPNGAGADGMSLREAFGSIRFLIVTLGFAFGFYAFYAILVHFVPYATAAGISRGTAALGLGLIGGASIPARLGAGYLSDRYGRIPVLVAGYALTCGAVGGMIFAVGSAEFLLLAVLFGIGTGATSALYSPIVADMFDEADVGKMLGLTSVAFGVAGVAGPYATGVAFEATGSYAPALLLAAACSVVGPGLISLAYSERLAGRTVY